MGRSGAVINDMPTSRSREATKEKIADFDVVTEWLRRLTRNQLQSLRAGSIEVRGGREERGGREGKGEGEGEGEGGKRGAEGDEAVTVACAGTLTVN